MVLNDHAQGVPLVEDQATRQAAPRRVVAIFGCHRVRDGDIAEVWVPHNQETGFHVLGRTDRAVQLGCVASSILWVELPCRETDRLAITKFHRPASVYSTKPGQFEEGGGPLRIFVHRKHSHVQCGSAGYQRSWRFRAIGAADHA